jgi:hypothetical protein
MPHFVVQHVEQIAARRRRGGVDARGDAFRAGVELQLDAVDARVNGGGVGREMRGDARAEIALDLRCAPERREVGDRREKGDQRDDAEAARSRLVAGRRARAARQEQPAARQDEEDRRGEGEVAWRKNTNRRRECDGDRCCDVAMILRRAAPQDDAPLRRVIYCQIVPKPRTSGRSCCAA